VTAERLEATVRGVVQGVGFRWFVVRRASDLALTGWASNQSDGSVRIVAEGPPEALDQLVRHLNDGPSGAHVQSVESARAPATAEFTSFTIRAGAHRGD
jgi:acylphosphatase